LGLIAELDVPLECVWRAEAVLGEGPVWLPAKQQLLWVDVKSQLVHLYSPDENLHCSYLLPEPIGACLPAVDGRFLCALKSGLMLLDLPDHAGSEVCRIKPAALTPFADPEPKLAGNRFNDAKIDGQGRLWVGSMDDREQDPTGALYRVNWDGNWQLMDQGYIVTNGPAFSPDGRTLYHTDTFAGEIHAFDLDTAGELSGKRLHIKIPPVDGFPDGMTVDNEGYIWLAHFAGGRLTRFDPSGRAVSILRLPVSNVTSCAFGGPNLDRLYITTARWTLDDDAIAAEPLAGGLFMAEVDCRGAASPVFGRLS
jgi:sugar lactone lactonase YvrE